MAHDFPVAFFFFFFLEYLFGDGTKVPFRHCLMNLPAVVSTAPLPISSMFCAAVVRLLGCLDGTGAPLPISSMFRAAVVRVLGIQKARSPILNRALI